MTTGPPPNLAKTSYASSELRRTAALPGRFEDPFARQYATNDKLYDEAKITKDRRAGPVEQHATSDNIKPLQSLPQAGLPSAERPSSAYTTTFNSPQAQRLAFEQWQSRQLGDFREALPTSPWTGSPLVGQYPTDPMSSAGEPNPKPGYAAWPGQWSGPLLRRTSSEEARLSQLGSYYGGEGSTSTSSLHGKAYPQRRPSNRDEFDGPSQLLDKPEDSGYEPKEEELPQLPITLYAQEQDDMLSKVNDRLSQCAFDFVAKYQFPIPIEADKRPVRVPADREWSEWVYLMKRLATKRRIPSRVLYNGQIKQLITILENSLEMRHAAKHQSRPLKDDRNILQLISSGLQVAKILKDAPAMRYLDSLYVQTERLIQSRRA